MAGREFFVEVTPLVDGGTEVVCVWCRSKVEILARRRRHRVGNRLAPERLRLLRLLSLLSSLRLPPLQLSPLRLLPSLSLLRLLLSLLCLLLRSLLLLSRRLGFRRPK